MTDITAGSSRVALAAARERLDALVRQLGAGADPVDGRASVVRLAEDLVRVTALLGSQRTLLRAVADPGASPEARAALLARVLGEQVGPDALDLLSGVVRDRWSAERHLAIAIGQLAAEAFLAVAELDGDLDRVEDELFRVARTVAGNAELALTLSSPAVSTQRKVALLRALLAGKAHPVTVSLSVQAVTDTGGRGLDERLDALVRQAAARRSRLVAVVRVAQLPTDAQADRLAAALSAQAGRTVGLQIVLDPAVLGGVVVELGGEVIDGSVAHRLAAARNRLART
jgi:F-type H+-transporting ATPase subunit delta